MPQTDQDALVAEAQAAWNYAHDFPYGGGRTASPAKTQVWANWARQYGTQLLALAELAVSRDVKQAGGFGLESADVTIVRMGWDDSEVPPVFTATCEMSAPPAWPLSVAWRHPARLTPISTPAPSEGSSPPEDSKSVLGDEGLASVDESADVEERSASLEGVGYERGSVVWFSSEEEGGPDVGIQIGLGSGYGLYAGELAKVTLEEHEVDLAEFPDSWWLVLYGPDDTYIMGAVPDADRAREALEHISGLIQRAPSSQHGDAAPGPADRVGSSTPAPSGKGGAS